MKRQDDGFTITELMIAMLIMGIITVPLVSAFVLGLTTTGRGIQDATNSSDAQLLGSFFEPDISNAETVSVSGTCGTGDASVLQANWLDGANSMTVSYWTYPDVTDTGLAVLRLERHECTNGVESGHQVLARSLTAAPVLACDSSPCTSVPSRPRRISLVATELGRTTSDPTFEVDLTATRRVTP